MNDLILNLSMNTIVLRLIWQRATGSPSFSGSFKVLEHSDFHFEIIIQICGLNDGHFDWTTRGLSFWGLILSWPGSNNLKNKASI